MENNKSANRHKENHKASDAKWRANINNSYNTLKLIPEFQYTNKRVTKAAVANKTLDYIKHLEQTLEEKMKSLQLENKTIPPYLTSTEAFKTQFIKNNFHRLRKDGRGRGRRRVSENLVASAITQQKQVEEVIPIIPRRKPLGRCNSLSTTKQSADSSAANNESSWVSFSTNDDQDYLERKNSYDDNSDSNKNWTQTSNNLKEEPPQSLPGFSTLLPNQEEKNTAFSCTSTQEVPSLPANFEFSDTASGLPVQTVPLHEAYSEIEYELPLLYQNATHLPTISYFSLANSDWSFGEQNKPFDQGLQEVTYDSSSLDPSLLMTRNDGNRIDHQSGNIVRPVPLYPYNWRTSNETATSANSTSNEIATHENYSSSSI